MNIQILLLTITINSDEFGFMKEPLLGCIAYKINFIIRYLCPLRIANMLQASNHKNLKSLESFKTEKYKYVGELQRFFIGLSFYVNTSESSS